MKKILALSFLILLAVQSLHSQNVNNKRVVGYYNWDNSSYPSTAIDFTNLTHICHAFIWPLANGSIDQSQISLYPAMITAAHSKGVLVLVSIGGYGTADQNAGFKSMVNSSTARAAFITNLVNFIKSNKYDGADFDWEYPSSADKDNFTALITDLRAAFNANNIPLITAAVYNSPTGGYDVPKLNQLLDWIGIMTYDFTGNWEQPGTRLIHNAALYGSSQQTYSIDKSVNAWVAGGMSASKICAGMPFYGYLMNAPDMYGSITTTAGAKALSYSTIASSYLNNSGWQYNFDNTTKTPYLRNTAHTQVISFDDTTSIRMKCDYINSRGLAGTIIWKIAQSYNGTTKTNPLLKTAGDFLIKSGTVYNSSVVLTSPRGGEVWPAISTHNISWTSSVVSYVRLDYSTNNGASWTTITSSVPASAGSYSWKVPNTLSVQCKVRIVDTANPGVADTSSNAFEISIAVPSAVVLSSPSNNAVSQDTALTLSWNPIPVAATYKVQVSKDQNFSSFVLDDSTVTSTSIDLKGLSSSTKYFWRVAGKNSSGTGIFSAVWNFTTGTITLVEDINNAKPKDYVLYQNYPNPFNPATKIRYSLPAESHVRIRIYDAIGSFVTELVNEIETAGYKEVTFNAGNLSSGTYFCSMTATSIDGSREITSIRKAILVK
ncbi:MAG: T9SS type A sorting domain-containing protein [Ignavibacteria bacterium]|jgi:chitinase|nr:T9SS type A sorting domain-containing protein [Ignavibacteria bacterium]MCU7502252.1 T9SS type A sorting domain-containing protein [Ignavibacteria bacterium]MCU7516704.1 T9SS type A sorting domain-containing protein [Ignavibacteria bacterium]